MQYYLNDQSWDGFECHANTAKNNWEICGTLKYLCHDGNAQNELALGEEWVCQVSQTIYFKILMYHFQI